MIIDFPPLEWVHLLGTLNGLAYSITSGPDGSIYVGGSGSQTLNSGTRDVFLVKYKADGTKAWTQWFGAADCTATASGPDGSIYIGGHTSGSLGYSNSGGVDGFLIKYAEDGAVAWTKMLGTSGNDYVTSVKTGADGSIYVIGYTSNSLYGQTNRTGFDTFIVKYAADGNKAWTKSLGTSQTVVAASMAIGLDGSIYVCEDDSGSLYGQPNNTGFGSGFLVKYAADGTKVWTKSLGTSQTVVATALAIDPDGSIYIGGHTSGSLNGQSNSGGEDGFVIKYAADGTVAWTKMLGTSGYEAVTSIAIGYGSIYIGGWTSGSLDGQPIYGTTEAFLVKYAADGTKAWTQLLDEGIVNGAGYAKSVNGAGYASSIAIGPYGSIYLGGYTFGLLNGQKPSANCDTFLAKYVDSGVWTYVITADRPSVNEGDVVTFKLTTTNVAPGTSLAYTLLGTKNAAICSGNGTVTVDGAGEAVITKGIPGMPTNNGTGDSGTLKISVGDASATVQIVDVTPTYRLTSNATSVNEGDTVTFTLTTTNVAPGTLVPYTLLGTYNAAIYSGTGNAVIDSTEKAVIEIPLSANTGVGDSGILKLTILTPSELRIHTTYGWPYCLVHTLDTTTSVNEGSTATFTFTNVGNGIALQYTLTGPGISSNDILGGELVGFARVNSGAATISIPIANDNLTEGPEKLTIKIFGATESILINDTSAPITGTPANDLLTGTGRSETIDGGAGTDTVVYSGNRSNFLLNKTGSNFSLTNKTGAPVTDVLQNMERIKFSDGGVALDVGATQSAGETAQLLGAVLPGRMVFDASKQALLGAAIDLFDQGYSLQTLSGAVMRLPIWDILTGKATPSSTDIATYLLTNVNGVAPDATTLADAVTALNAETSFATQGNFLWHLAESSANQTHVGLVGLAATGLAYGW